MRRAHELEGGSWERAEGSEASHRTTSETEPKEMVNVRKGPQGVTVLSVVCDAER